MGGPRFEVLWGANRYAPHSVCRVTLGRYGPRRGQRLPAGTPRLSALLRLFPFVAPSDPIPDQGFDLPVLILTAVTGLLRESDLAPRHSAVASAAPGGETELVFDCEDTDLARRTVELVLKTFHHLLDSPAGAPGATSWDPQQALAAYRRHASARGPTADSLYLLREARRRDIPTLYLGQDRVVLGQGSRQRRLHRKVTDRTGHLAYVTATDKRACHEALRRLGLPVPRQVLVTDPAAARGAAEAIGYPVVVKPLAADMGLGVTVGVQDPDALARAVAQARTHHRGVLVEALVPGDDHRLLVVEGAFVAAARRVPAHVVGDGRSTVAELVAAENRNPLRAPGKGRPLTAMVLDAGAIQVLAEQGLTSASTPTAGTTVWLRRAANLSRGGLSVDVTHLVHPDNRRLAETAARAIGLDIAGVDLLTTDITRSWRDVGGAICEVNPSPGLRAHYAPGRGAGRDVAAAVFRLLFPHGGTGRIPAAVVTGSNGKTTTARMLAHILRAAGHRVGLACTDGTYVDGEPVALGDHSGGKAAWRLLLDPRIDAAVLEVARGAILKYGTGVEACDVAAVTNLADEHLGELGVQTREDLARVKGTLVPLARRAVVLNADDPLCASLASLRRAGSLVLVGLEQGSPLLEDHVAGGGWALTVAEGAEGTWIVVRDGDRQQPLARVADLPAAWEGRARHNLRNALFAAAMALALKTPAPRVARALATFRGDALDNPGRLNRYDGLPYRVILDRCDNSHGMAALGKVVATEPVAGSRTAAISMAGNRRDEDLRAMGRETARHFHRVVVFPPPQRYLRGRAASAITGLLAEGLRSAGMPDDRITVAPSPDAAAQWVFESAAPDDLVVACFAVDVFRERLDALRFGPSAGETLEAVGPMG